MCTRGRRCAVLGIALVVGTVLTADQRSRCDLWVAGSSGADGRNSAELRRPLRRLHVLDREIRLTPAGRFAGRSPAEMLPQGWRRRGDDVVSAESSPVGAREPATKDRIAFVISVSTVPTTSAIPRHRAIGGPRVHMRPAECEASSRRCGSPLRSPPPPRPAGGGGRPVRHQTRQGVIPRGERDVAPLPGEKTRGAHRRGGDAAPADSKAEPSARRRRGRSSFR